MRTLLTWVDRRQALPAQQILAGEPGRVHRAGPEPPRRHRRHRRAGAERHLVHRLGIADRIPLRPGAGRHRRPRFRPGTVRPRRRTPSTCGRSGPPPGHGRPHGGRSDRRHPPRHLRTQRRRRRRPASRPPVVLALDEVANIAPIPDFPSMISEGGGQGLVTLACLQDLSQARSRWPDHADGFPSLFGTTVVLPGIGDVRTLEALSTLAGDEEIPTRTVSAGRTSTGPPVRRPGRRRAVPARRERVDPVASAAARRRHHPRVAGSRVGLRRAKPAGVDPAGPVATHANPGAPCADRAQPRRADRGATPCRSRTRGRQIER